MKTRERIIATALALFNEQGEAHTTALDIADELDMSPGNLYYHFKGKEPIIDALFDRFEAKISATLAAPIAAPLGQQDSIENNWFYLFVLLEDMHDYRFIYNNLTDLIDRYTTIERGFARILKLKRAAFYALSDQLIPNNIDLREQQLSAIADNLSQTATFWFTFDRLIHGPQSAEVGIHRGVLQLLTMIAPYLGSAQLQFYRDCEVIFDSLQQSSQH